MSAFALCLIFCLLTLGGLRGQDAPLVIQDPEKKEAPLPSLAPTSAPIKLDISRRDLNNFLTDKEALAPYPLNPTDGTSLKDVFMIGAVNAPFAIFWDPLSCRLIGALLLDAPEPSPSETRDNETAPFSPYVMKAEGPMPLARSAGAFGNPVYFGLRLVGDMPEFLYTVGSLAIEERIWLEDEGKLLKQRFSVREAPQGFQITFPKEWQNRVKVSLGTWKENILSVPKESIDEVILTYRLIDAQPESAPAN